MVPCLDPHAPLPKCTWGQVVMKGADPNGWDYKSIGRNHKGEYRFCGSG